MKLLGGLSLLPAGGWWAVIGATMSSVPQTICKTADAERIFLRMSPSRAQDTDSGLQEDSDRTKSRQFWISPMLANGSAQLRDLVAACEQAASLGARAELTSALTAIIDDATQLRML